jgi:hypothetical protein
LVCTAKSRKLPPKVQRINIIVPKVYEARNEKSFCQNRFILTSFIAFKFRVWVNSLRNAKIFLLQNRTMCTCVHCVPEQGPKEKWIKIYLGSP